MDRRPCFLHNWWDFADIYPGFTSVVAGQLRSTRLSIIGSEQQISIVYQIAVAQKYCALAVLVASEGYNVSLVKQYAVTIFIQVIPFVRL